MEESLFPIMAFSAIIGGGGLYLFGYWNGKHDGIQSVRLEMRRAVTLTDRLSLANDLLVEENKARRLRKKYSGTERERIRATTEILKQEISS